MQRLRHIGARPADHAVVAAALFAWAIPDNGLAHRAGHPVAAVASRSATIFPLLWRRRSPLPALAATSLLVLLPWGLPRRP